MADKTLGEIPACSAISFILYLFVLKRKSVRIFLLNLPYELICIKQNKDTAFMLHICFISIVSVLLNHEEIVS